MSDFLSACSQTYALAETGLFRLSPQAGGLGVWARESVTDADTYTFGSDALATGRLAFARGALSFEPQGGCLVGR